MHVYTLGGGSYFNVVAVIYLKVAFLSVYYVKRFVD